MVSFSAQRDAAALRRNDSVGVLILTVNHRDQYKSREVLPWFFHASRRMTLPISCSKLLIQLVDVSFNLAHSDANGLTESLYLSQAYKAVVNSAKVNGSSGF